MSSVTISHRLGIYKNPSLILFKSQKRFSILRWENVAFGEFLKTGQTEGFWFCMRFTYQSM